MIESNRRLRAEEELGLSNNKEKARMEKSIAQEEERLAIKLAKRQKLETMAEYKLLKGISKTMDVYFLDPIIGFIPVVGDAITAALALPFIYVSVTKIKSASLTLAIIHNVMVDAFVGMLPFYIGNFLDFFIRSHKKNLKLIVGFVEDDKDVIREVNRKAISSLIGILIFIGLIYYLITLIASIMDWVMNLFK